MTKELKHTLFNSSDCISEKTMFDYIDNKLSPKEQHIVEKHMLDCELCADALEGLKLLTDRKKIKQIDDLIKRRISENKTKIIGIDYRIILSVAAGLLLLIGGVFFFQFSGIMIQEKDVADLSIPEKKESASKEFPSGETDSKDLLTITKEESASSGENEKKGKSKNVSPATDQKSREDISRSIANNGSGADSKGYTFSQSQAQDEDLKNTPESKTDIDQTISLQNSITQNNNYKSDESKDKGIKTTSEEQDNEGYYAKEQTTSKAAETSKAVKTENKKKENKREEAKPASEPAINIAYAPADVLEKNADLNRNTTRSSGNETGNFESTITNPSESLAEYEEALSIADEMPEYPGGNIEMQKFIRKNFNYSKIALNDDVSKTKIIVRFIVDKNGNIKNPKVIKGIDPELDKEAIRIVKLMPSWKPGKQNGNNVDVIFDLPIELDQK